MAASLSVVAAVVVAAVCFASAPERLGMPFEVELRSSVDGKEQRVIVQVSNGYNADAPAPLLVGLHTWSGGYKQQVAAMAPKANALGWLLVLPDFRGPNLVTNPSAQEACASILAQSDVVDAVDYMRKTYAVDSSRIYLMGASGGGHMAMMMAGKHPDLWAGVSAWAGISDLCKWQQETPSYAAHVHACLGGKPGDSPEVDWQYTRRSPITFIQNASPVCLDLQHGRHDGTVPYHHTVDAYERVSQVPGHRARVTVFDGGHTIKYALAFNWLAKQVKNPSPARALRLTTDEDKTYSYVHLVPASPMALGRCGLDISEHGSVSLNVARVRELGIDCEAAGLCATRPLRIVYAADGACEALVLTGLARPRQVGRDGAALRGWAYDDAQKAVRVPVGGVREASLRLSW